jgi:hypothetical protein
MSMVAIFAMSCCGRQIVFGRFRGNEMNPPSVAKCQFGCRPRFVNGRQERFKLTFVEYQIESMCSPELLDTWILKNRTGDLWHKYNRAWLKGKEALNQGVAR